MHSHPCTLTITFILFASFSTTQQQPEFEKGARNCNEFFTDKKALQNSIWHFNSNSLQSKQSTSQWRIMENKEIPRGF